MKHLFVSTLFLSAIFCCYAAEVNKVSEFSKTAVYQNSFNNMTVQGDYLYVINNRSLEVFQIYDDSIHLITDFNLQGKLISLSVKDGFAYIATSSYTSRLYRLDISDLLHIKVTDTLHLRGSYVQFIDGNHVFVHELQNGNTWKAHVYDNETFGKLASIEVPHEYWPFTYVKSGKAIISKYDTTFLYDISNLENIRLLGSDETGRISFPNHAEIYKDSVLFISSDISKFKAYNISDPEQWYLLDTIDQGFSNFRISGSHLIALSDKAARLYEISELTRIAELDKSMDKNFDHNVNLTMDKERFFITTARSSLLVGEIIQNQFEYIQTKRTIGHLSSAFLYKDYVFILSEYNGISSWNISNPDKPIYQETWLEDRTILDMHGDSNIIITLEYNPDTQGYINVIYDINEDGSLQEIDKLDLSYGLLRFNIDVGFFSLSADGTLYKYLLKNNKIEVSAKVILPDIKGGNIYFYNDLFFICTREGQISVVQTDFINYKIISQIDLYIKHLTEISFIDGFMFLCNPHQLGGDCSMVNISDPYKLSWFSTIDNSGHICIDNKNKTLFIANTACTIYNMADTKNDFTKPINTFQNWSKSTDIKVFEKNSRNYILYLEDCSVSIYDYHVN